MAKYHFPKLGKTVEAKNLKEAIKLTEVKVVKKPKKED